VTSHTSYRSTPIIVFFDIHIGHFAENLHQKAVAQWTEHDDFIKPLLRGAPRLGLALGPAPFQSSPEGVDVTARIKEIENKSRIYSGGLKVPVLPIGLC